MRILHEDDRWRNDKYYLFYVYDMITQARLLTVNNILSASTNIRNKINVGTLKKNDFDDYYKYGSYIPKSITGSKSYWKGKYLDLMAIINNNGLPDLFKTLTANDSWQGLEQKLNNYEDILPLHHPVDVSEYFFQRLHILISQIKKGLLGKCLNYWYRIELQNRGALHVHMLIWNEKDKKKRYNLIDATLPSGSSENSKILRNKVKKLQVHTCRELRCFKSGKRIYKRCKYGFPFDLCDEDHLDESTNTFKYKRLNDSDRLIVPYNAALLLLWDGHINIQYITQRGIEQYLVKYISKVEPSQFINYSNESAVKQFLELRIVSSIEAAALLCGHHFVQSTFNV